jgi:quercetin dioxygenase-like cupin family protein
MADPRRLLMHVIPVTRAGGAPVGTHTADVVLDAGAVKVRRIELGRGARIPPCRMREDVVFVVLDGRVIFREEGESVTVESPGAVYIPGGASERSMEAEASALVLAVLCKSGDRLHGDGQ